MSQDAGSAGAATSAGATTTTTTAAGAPPSTGGITTQTAPTQTDWTSGLNDELRGYVTTKGFKDPSAVLESYRNYEKLQGVPQDRLLKIPESLDGDEGRAIFERLGKPKDKAGYSIAIPKEHGDEKLAEAFRDLAYQNNFTQKQAEGLVGWWNKMNEGRSAEMKNSLQAKSIAADEALKRDWGNAYEQNKNIAERGAIAMGFGEQELQALGQALGPDKALKMLHKLGAATGEHEFVGGQGAGGGKMAADQARAMIAQLGADKGFIERLRAGDSTTGKQWNDLHLAAYPGTMSL